MSSHNHNSHNFIGLTRSINKALGSGYQQRMNNFKPILNN